MGRVDILQPIKLANTLMLLTLSTDTSSYLLEFTFNFEVASKHRNKVIFVMKLVQHLTKLVSSTRIFIHIQYKISNIEKLVI